LTGMVLPVRFFDGSLPLPCFSTSLLSGTRLSGFLLCPPFLRLCVFVACSIADIVYHVFRSFFCCPDRVWAAFFCFSDLSRHDFPSFFSLDCFQFWLYSLLFTLILFLHDVPETTPLFVALCCLRALVPRPSYVRTLVVWGGSCVPPLWLLFPTTVLRLFDSVGHFRVGEGSQNLRSLY